MTTVHGGHTINAPAVLRLVDLRAYDSTGVGHLMPSGRYETRHPCGEQVRAERFRHPATVPCARCVGAGWTEGEQREAWGR